MQDLKQIDGFDISFHEKSKRIINIKIEDEIIERLIFPFKKFDITALALSMIHFTNLSL